MRNRTGMYQEGGTLGLGWYGSVDEVGGSLQLRSSGVVSGQGAIQQKGSRSGWKVKVKVKVKAILALVHSYMHLAEHKE